MIKKSLIIGLIILGLSFSVAQAAEDDSLPNSGVGAIDQPTHGSAQEHTGCIPCESLKAQQAILQKAAEGYTVGIQTNTPAKSGGAIESH